MTRRSERSAVLREKLAALLGVAPDAIDGSESFEALGVDPVHRAALAAWLETNLKFRMPTGSFVMPDLSISSTPRSARVRGRTCRQLVGAAARRYRLYASGWA